MALRWMRGAFSPFWLAFYGASAVFFVIAHFTQAKPFAEQMRIFQIALNIAVVLAYLTPAANASVSPQPSGTQQLTLGITIAWVATIMQSIWVLLWRMSGQPSWMMNSDVINYTTMLQCMGAALHISAPEAMPDGVPKRFAVRLGLSVGLAVLVVLIFFEYRPDARGIVEWMRPFIEEPNSGYDAGAAAKIEPDAVER